MAGRVFVTGDTHGNYDIRKLASRTFKSHAHHLTLVAGRWTTHSRTVRRV